MTVAALAVSSASLTVGLVVLYFTVGADRRARERSHVDWQADRVDPSSPGTFLVWNIGTDAAHDVTVQLWTPEEEVAETAALVKPGDGVVLTLPQREGNGPDDVLLIDVPHLPNDPVSEIIRRQTEEQREMMISTQVTVEAVWRSRLGTWSDKHFKTG